MKRARARTTLGQKLLLVGVGVFVLVLIEVGLRVTGVADRNRHDDPFVGFERVYPLFGERRLPNGKEVFATNENKLSFFNYQEFKRKKSTDTFRIFCFGGSTTYGRPYQAETAFPRWLELNLNLLDSHRRYEVINAGGISYASYRVVHLVEEAVRYEPDLFVVYSGHNEFLEARTYEKHLTQAPTLKRLRILVDKLDLYVLLRNTILAVKRGVSKTGDTGGRTLEDEVATILDASAGLERYTRETLQKESTFEHYRYNLRRIVDIARKHDIKIVLATLTSNVKDFSPFKSEHEGGLSEVALTEWSGRYQRGLVLQKKGEYKDALVAYEKCLSIDNQHAELVYRIGQCLYETGQYDLAKRYYHTAKELDICPLRAPEEINFAIRELSERLDVPLLDVETEFERLGTHGIPDGNCLIDHVHPTIQGNQTIAEAIVRVLQEEGIVSADRAVSRDSLDLAYRSVLKDLSPGYYAKGLLNLAKVLGWAGKEEEKATILARNGARLQGHYEYHYMLGNTAMRREDLNEAIEHYGQSLKLNPDFSESYTNLGFALSQSGQPDQALKNYRKALSLDSNDFVAQTNIARISYIKGDYRTAISEYKKAVEMKADYPHAHEGLGVVYYKQGNLTQALKELNRAVGLNPNYAEAYYNIGLIDLDQRRIDEAVRNFKKAVASDPHYADAHCSLGVSYYHQKMLDEAIEQLQLALTINPSLGKAHNNLAVAYYTKGNYAKAKEHLDRAQSLRYDVNPDFVETLKAASTNH